MQDPKVENAIAAASVPDDGSDGSNSSASADSLTLLVELAEPDAFRARVRQAERNVTVHIPGALPPPPPPIPPVAPPTYLSAAQGISRTPLWVTLATVLTALVAVA